MARELTEGSERAAAREEADPEFDALVTVVRALKDLPPDVQSRVIDYAVRRLGLSLVSRGTVAEMPDRGGHPRVPIADAEPINEETSEAGAEGINPVAQKWMRRNGLTPDALSRLFSLGLDDIDLVAQKVPGKQVKEKMRSVLLLKGVAAYLGSGAPRVSDEELRQACVHYGAYDKSNFAANLKSFGSEASGTRESGYTLTSRGLVAATDVIKEMTSAAG